MKYFVIEHPTRGWYLGAKYEWFGPGYKWMPHFAYSILGRDDRVKKMYSKSEVERELCKISEKVREKCRVKEFD